MATAGGIVLVLGSGPQAGDCRVWPRQDFDAIVAINNAWRLRPDWDVLIHPDDFPPERLPGVLRQEQRTVGAAEYVPALNRFGGVLYGGGTMAFTAGYWALAAMAPRVLAFFGCDMVYPPSGPTHFYGKGAADPLRPDPTLQSLEAKSARLELLAARQGCACVNLSTGASRLGFPRQTSAAAGDAAPLWLTDGPWPPEVREQALGYAAPDGRYWERPGAFDPAMLAEVDALWLEEHARQTGARPIKDVAAR